MKAKLTDRQRNGKSGARGRREEEQAAVSREKETHGGNKTKKKEVQRQGWEKVVAFKESLQTGAGP